MCACVRVCARSHENAYKYAKKKTKLVVLICKNELWRSYDIHVWRAYNKQFSRAYIPFFFVRGRFRVRVENIFWSV